jgi:hypothetical protein
MNRRTGLLAPCTRTRSTATASPLPTKRITIQCAWRCAICSWRAKLPHGAVIELGRGSVDDVMTRVQRVSKTLAQVTQKLGRKVTAMESADLRYDNGYALRMRGVSTQDVSAKR